MSTKSKRHITSKHVTTHVQMSHEVDEVDVGSSIEPVECSRINTAHTIESDENCIRTLINLLDHLKMSKCHLTSPKASSVEYANLQITPL